MHEGFVRVLDNADTKRLGIAGRLGRARGIHTTGMGGAVTDLGIRDAAGKFQDRVPCEWVENTCRCWPADATRCDECREI